jgi:hypothetical protein
MHSFLAWAVDALDVYFSLLHRKPDYIQDDTLKNTLSACGRSVYQKAQAFASYVPGVSVEASLVEVLITWRNNVMHELADNIVASASRKVIAETAAGIATNYHGLDPTRLCEKAEDGSDLSFKETASLIKAAHNFVEQIDAHLLSRLSLPKFYDGVLRDRLSDEKVNKGFVAMIFDLDSPDWRRVVSNWLSNCFCVAQPVDDGSLQYVRDAVLVLKRDKESAKMTSGKH